MKYVILIYDNPRSREVWEQLPVEQRRAGLAAYRALDEELADSGELIVSHALAMPETATRVAVRGSETVTSDGPFAEAKEVLAGFYLVECAGRERAVEIAARIPEAVFGTVEIRPVMNLSAFET